MTNDQPPTTDHRPATSHRPATRDHARSEPVAEGPLVGISSGDALGRAGAARPMPTGDQATNQRRIIIKPNCTEWRLLRGVQRVYGVGSPRSTECTTVYGVGSTRSTECTTPSVVHGVTVYGVYHAVGGPGSVYGAGVRSGYGVGPGWCTVSVYGVGRCRSWLVYGVGACSVVYPVTDPWWFRRLVSGCCCTA